MRASRAYMLIFLLCFLDCLTTYFLLLKYDNVELEFNPFLRELLKHTQSYHYVFAYVFLEFAYFSLAYRVIEKLRVKAEMRVKLEYSVFFLLLLAITSNTIGLLVPAGYKYCLLIIPWGQRGGNIRGSLRSRANIQLLFPAPPPPQTTFIALSSSSMSLRGVASEENL